MPAGRRYQSNAEKQAAYRQRCRARREAEAQSNGPAQVPSTPGYRRWRMMREQAIRLLETAAGEMELYHSQRSEMWQDSERGEALSETMESLADIAAALREVDSG